MIIMILLIGLLAIGMICGKMSATQVILYVALGALGGWLIAGCGPTPDAPASVPVNNSVQKLMI